jgi:hypothetical protein
MDAISLSRDNMGFSMHRDSQIYAFRVRCPGSILNQDNGPMNNGQMNFLRLIKQPSAFLPISMSLGALALVLGHIFISGTAREADEGTAAHIFQLLMVAEVPIVAFFAIKWLPRFPRQALPVMALQAIAGLAALFPVFYFNL